MSIVSRVVEGNLPGVQPLKRRPQRFAKGLVIANHFTVSAALTGIFGIVMAHNRNPFTVAGDEKSALPGDIMAQHKGQDRVTTGGGFTHQGHPEIDALFL